MRSSKNDLTRAVLSDSAQFVGRLKWRIDFWKPRREETIKALRDLATKCDSKVSRNNAVKLAGAGTSILVTLAGAGAVLLTGGLATPFVVGGAALAIGGGVAVGAGDYLNSVCSKEAREETQKTLDKEKNAYEDVRLVMQELQHTLESTSVDHGWPQEEGLAKLLSVKFKVEVGGITIEGGPEGARVLRIGLTATELITDYKKALQAAKAAADGAQAAANGTKLVAGAAKEAGNVKVYESAYTAAKAAEDAAVAARKNFKTSKDAVNATRKAVEASEAAAKAAVEASEAAGKAANAASKATSGALNGLKNFFFGTAKEVKEGIEAANKFAKVASEGAEVASKGAKAALSGARIVSKTGMKILGKAIPLLNVVFLLLDAKDMAEAGMQLARGESTVGHHVRSKAEEMEEEVAYVEALYLRLKAAV